MWGLSHNEDNPMDIALDVYHFRDFLAVFDLRDWEIVVKVDKVYAFPIYNCSSYTPTYEEALKSTVSNISIPGYLQSWKYFHPQHLGSLSKLLKVHPRILNKARAVLRSCSPLGGNDVITVGIHVRRGDIIEVAHHANHGHLPASEEYFRKSIKFFKERFHGKRVAFVVVSNDLKWCKNIFKEFAEVGYVEYDGDYSNAERAGIEMCTLALCDHLIQSVGTFSWWAAYLHKILVSKTKESLVLYFHDWPRKGSTFEKQVRPADYFLPEWIPM